MGNETASYAVVLERIGKKVLQALQDLPERALDWVPPLPVCHSLLDCATELITAGEFWINTVIAGQNTQSIERDELLVVLYTYGEHSYLIARYERWLHTLHEILDELSDTCMDMVIILPPYHRAFVNKGPATVRDCLLHLIECSAYKQGKILLLCQFYKEAEQLSTQNIDQPEESTSYQTSEAKTYSTMQADD
ncbi:MAG TPA: hypothetical protein VFB12_31330 [Ktedonobacteraceae bacterium]|nr:hypothetical protein [Ktedonobacteraceae bacterium]